MIIFIGFTEILKILDITSNEIIIGNTSNILITMIKMEGALIVSLISIKTTLDILYRS